jgi:hypothetical protein
MRPRATGYLVAMVCVAGVGGCGFKPAGTTLGTGGTTSTGAAGTSGGGGSTAGAAGTRVVITGAGGTLSTGGNTGAGGNMGMSTLDANCGAKDKPAMRLLPNILIVLDRSGSMNDDIMNRTCTPDGGGMGARNCGPNSKWAQAAPAIMQVVTETQTDVNWGLKFFPDNQQMTCNVSMTAAVPIGAMNGAAVSTAIMGATDAMGGVVGYNNTPTRSGMNGAVAYMNTLTDMNPKYILLATDGLPNCGASGSATTDDSAGAVTAVMAAATAGYKTFVVGIATAGVVTNMVDANMTLSNMANAGGLARTGMTPTYYPVTTTADLATAIRMLVSTANNCTFRVGPTPTTDGTTNLGFINVFGDGREIPKDTTHTNGWDYTDASMESIQIYGSTCTEIMSATIQNVTVTFRCLFG